MRKDNQIIFDILIEFARGNFQIDYDESRLDDDDLSAIIQGLRMMGEEMEDRIGRLSLANAELEKLNQQLKEFNYITVHDLRSPLASQMGLINLMKDDPENTPECLKLMEQNISKLDNTITDLLTFSKTKIKDFNVQKINLQKTINDVLVSINSMDNFPNIHFIREINYPQSFYSDNFLFQTIIKNLITNAVKYHRKEIDDAFILIKMEKKGKGIEILIQDNGMGIPNDIQDKIFHKVIRGAHDVQGTGLGLYISYGAVVKLKGSISFTSEPNKGTSFNLYIPNAI